MEPESGSPQPQPPSNEEAPAQQQLLPRCPHCKVDPLKTMMFTIVRGDEKLVIFFCANPDCRCVLGTNITSVQPAIVPGTILPRPRLV